MSEQEKSESMAADPIEKFFYSFINGSVAPDVLINILDEIGVFSEESAEPSLN